MPEETDNYIRLPLPNEEGKHTGHKIRTKTISKKLGIKALYCIDCKKLITFLFIKAAPFNWTMSKAKNWLSKNKKIKAYDVNESGQAVFQTIDENGNITEQTISEFSEALEPADPSEPAVPPDPSKLDTVAPPSNSISIDRTIMLFGGISSSTAERVCTELLMLDKADDKAPIRMIIASYGGEAYSAFSIVDTMEYVTAPIETIGLGYVMSAGLTIFMAGDKRYISQTASILSHRFKKVNYGTQAELEADRVEDDRIHQRILQHFVKFSKLKTTEEVEEVLLRETNVWLTPEEAMEHGLADAYFDKADEGGIETTKESFETQDILPVDIIGDSDLPISKDYVWEQEEAAARVLEWSLGKGTNLKDDYGRAFCHVDADKVNDTEAYILQFADIIDGKLTATWGGVKSAMSMVLGAHGGAKIPMEKKKSIFSFLSRYYKKFNKEAPNVILEAAPADTEFTEAIRSVEIVETAKDKPFRFRGVGLKLGAESLNGRYYPEQVCLDAVAEAKSDLSALTIMPGHPADTETNFLKVIGRVVELGVSATGEVEFIGEIANTTDGKDAQELLNFFPPGSHDISLRAGGKLRTENINGRTRDRVEEMHLRGFDIVLDGGVSGAKVKSVLENKQAGGDESMTGEEMKNSPEGKLLIVEARAEADKQVETMTADNESLKAQLAESQEAAKEFETKLAEAQATIDEHVATEAKQQIDAFREATISKLTVADSVKEMLRKRVSGETEEAIEESVTAELDYIKSLAPQMVSQDPKDLVKGVPAKEKEDEVVENKKPSDKDILKSGGNSENWQIAEGLNQPQIDSDDED